MGGWRAAGARFVGGLLGRGGVWWGCGCGCVWAAVVVWEIGVEIRGWGREGREIGGVGMRVG